MLLKSVNVNCHMVEGMSENDDLHRVRVEVLVRSFGGELNGEIHILMCGLNVMQIIQKTFVLMFHSSENHGIQHVPTKPSCSRRVGARNAKVRYRTGARRGAKCKRQLGLGDK